MDRPVPDPFEPFRLDGSVALVTGASGGLGERFAYVLDAAGASLVLSARRRDRLEEVASRCRDARVVTCDLADASSADALAASALEHFGGVDVLVNNAGAAQATPAFTEDMDECDGCSRSTWCRSTG